MLDQWEENQSGNTAVLNQEVFKPIKIYENYTTYQDKRWKDFYTML
jgi:hypothetical protein